MPVFQQPVQHSFGSAESGGGDDAVPVLAGDSSANGSGRQPLGLPALLHVGLAGGQILLLTLWFCSKSLFLTPLLVWSPSQVTSENVANLWNPWVQLFACQNLTLVVNLNRFFSSPSAEVAEKLPSELAAEWSDFFLEGISNLVLPLPVSITGRCPVPKGAGPKWCVRRFIKTMFSQQSSDCCLVYFSLQLTDDAKYG